MLRTPAEHRGSAASRSSNEDRTPWTPSSLRAARQLHRLVRRPTPHPVVFLCGLRASTFRRNVVARSSSCMLPAAASRATQTASGTGWSAAASAMKSIANSSSLWSRKSRASSRHRRPSSPRSIPDSTAIASDRWPAVIDQLRSNSARARVGRRRGHTATAKPMATAATGISDPGYGTDTIARPMRATVMTSANVLSYRIESASAPFDHQTTSQALPNTADQLRGAT